MYSKTNYLKEYLPLIYNLIDKNTPKSEISRILKVKQETLNSFFKKIGIEYKGNPSRKGIPHYSERLSVFYYLKNNKNISASKLRKLLIRDGIKEEKCECCGLSEWMGQKIPLELHHVNFNHGDNRLDNLQILCSNCHGIAHGYCNNKNTKELGAEEDTVNGLNTPTISHERYCLKKDKNTKNMRNKSLNPTQREIEYHIKERKCERPNKEVLANLIQSTPFVQIGKMYGVTDNAVRKWCKQYGLPYRKKDIKIAI